jgi:pimeloyl-ACP methyl ester carboxylesterase
VLYDTQHFALTSGDSRQPTVLTHTHFRGDLAAISIPVLVIHGDQDRVLPYEATSRRLPALLKNARSRVIAGGPHAIIWTHANEVNQALLDFIAHPGRRIPRQ